jgi:hypothetical protein
MNTRKPIGGFLGLEIPRRDSVMPLHGGSMALSTGRACLRAILEEVKPRRVHLPFYICEVVLDQLSSCGVEAVFYELDAKLEPANIPAPQPDEMLLAVNYFGLQGEQVRLIASQFGERCIVDNAQAFFDTAPGGCWTLHSARKFFGVPDGAYLSAPRDVDLRPLPARVPDARHLVSLLEGAQQEAFRQFAAYETGLDGEPRHMSRLSRELLAGCDYEQVANARRDNYRVLQSALASYNLFDATLPDGAVPLAYPLLLRGDVDRERLFERALYVPTFWPGLIGRVAPGFAFERGLASRLLPLPVDQRFDDSDMNEVVQRLVEALGSRLSPRD